MMALRNVHIHLLDVGRVEVLVQESAHTRVVVVHKPHVAPNQASPEVQVADCIPPFSPPLAEHILVEGFLALLAPCALAVLFAPSHVITTSFYHNLDLYLFHIDDDDDVVVAVAVVHIVAPDLVFLARHKHRNFAALFH